MCNYIHGCKGLLGCYESPLAWVWSLSVLSGYTDPIKNLPHPSHPAHFRLLLTRPLVSDSFLDQNIGEGHLWPEISVLRPRLLDKIQNLHQKLHVLWVSDHLCCEQGLRPRTLIYYKSLILTRDELFLKQTWEMKYEIHTDTYTCVCTHMHWKIAW